MEYSSKFLIYAGVASLTGSVIGAAVGNVVFPNIVMEAYSMMLCLTK